MRLIDADALLKKVEQTYCTECRSRKMDYNGARCRACSYGDELDDIESTSTVDPVKHGKWIQQHLEWKWEYRTYQCSECMHEQKWTSSYCPSCGVRMDKSENGVDLNP